MDTEDQWMTTTFWVFITCLVLFFAWALIALSFNEHAYVDINTPDQVVALKTGKGIRVNGMTFSGHSYLVDLEENHPMGELTDKLDSILGEGEYAIYPY